MKVSELSISDIETYLHIDEDDVDDAETAMLTSFLTAAKHHVKSYTGLTDEEMDAHEDLSIAVLCIAGDMYSNRDMISTAKGTENLTAKSIMNMYSVNLLPSADDADTETES